MFFSSSIGWPKQQEALRPLTKAHENDFPGPMFAHEFFRYIVTPLRGQWAFKPNGKAGTSTTLDWLHRSEFGVPVSATLDEPNGLNPDQAVHALTDARVFSFLPDRNMNERCDVVLEQAFRFSVVRHPLTRAVSGFRYLCRSNRARVARFSIERLRLTALTGFDWERHPDTEDGLLRYLDYVALERHERGQRLLDAHFRPQFLNLRPDVFKPHLIGKLEKMDAFFRDLADGLGRALPHGTESAKARNAQAGPDLGRSAEAVRRAAEVFAMDFDAFGYDPQHVPGAPQ